MRPRVAGVRLRCSRVESEAAARLLELIQAISHRGHLSPHGGCTLRGDDERPVVLDRNILFEAADPVRLALQKLGLLHN